MDEDFDIQIKSTGGQVHFYTTNREAVKEAEKDPTIWKISFNIASGEHIRLVRVEPTIWDRIFFWREKETEWVYSPI